MTNAQINVAFLKSANAKTTDTILGAIAKHYGTTQEAIRDEVTHDEAEHLLDYMVEPTRSATHVMMQKLGLSR